jgi:hypothetical protein
MTQATITETVIVFRFPDTSRAMRGISGEITDTLLVTIADSIGAVSWYTLGTIEGYPGSTVVTDCDYDAEGNKVATRTRPIGDESGPLPKLCDCGKAEWCPEFGIEFARQAKELA